MIKGVTFTVYTPDYTLNLDYTLNYTLKKCHTPRAGSTMRAHASHSAGQINKAFLRSPARALSECFQSVFLQHSGVLLCGASRRCDFFALSCEMLNKSSVVKCTINYPSNSEHVLYFEASSMSFPERFRGEGWLKASPNVIKVSPTYS